MSKILSYEQYAEIENKGFEMPYVLELEEGKRKLFFTGQNTLITQNTHSFKTLKSAGTALSLKSINLLRSSKAALTN